MKKISTLGFFLTLSMILLAANNHSFPRVDEMPQNGAFPLSDAAIYTDANDFTAEWRWNVLRGYASRCVAIPQDCQGQQRLRIYLLDPGIVIQEVLVR